ncbi:MAG: recombinase family protein [Methermicoccaceae archaeon]
MSGRVEVGSGSESGSRLEASPPVTTLRSAAAYHVAYLRVSRPDENVENQRLAIRNFLEKSGVNPDDVAFFEDVGVSGSVIPRARRGFRQLLDYIGEIKQRDPDAKINLYVYEISRLGRSFYETLSLIQKFERQNIRVVSASEKESFLNVQDESVRKLIIAIFAWLAEREREILIQRTKWGMQRALLEGKHIGRPKRAELSDYQVRRAKQYLEKGLSLADVARLLGVPYHWLRGELIKHGVWKVGATPIGAAHTRWDDEFLERAFMEHVLSVLKKNEATVARLDGDADVAVPLSMTLMREIAARARRRHRRHDGDGADGGENEGGDGGGDADAGGEVEGEGESGDDLPSDIVIRERFRWVAAKLKFETRFREDGGLSVLLTAKQARKLLRQAARQQEQKG